MNQAVTEYIEAIQQPWQVEVCKRLRATILQAVPEVEELKQYGKPHYKKHGAYLCVFNAAKAFVSVTLFNASASQAPEGLFEPADGSERRTIKIREGQAVDYDLLAGFLQEVASAC